MANYKPIVIDVKEGTIPPGVEEKWGDMSAIMPNFTRDIKTPALDSNSDLTAVVSGMPTIFARVNLFKKAIDYVGDNEKSQGVDQGLINFYTNLLDEWKGLIAAIALDYTRIEVRRIELAYSDGKTLQETANIYEPKGAFGNALFERKKLWSKQGVAANDNASPFIDVIFYDADTEGERKVIGAVSPESLLFTSPSYRIATDHPYVNKYTRKFTDPLRSSSFTGEDALTLLAYVDHIHNRLNELAKYYSGLPKDIAPNYAQVQTQLRNWRDEIKAYCLTKGMELGQMSIPPVGKFQEPNNLVFNYSSNLYGEDGTIYDGDRYPANAILFDPKKILLSKDSQIARIVFNDPEIARNPSLLQDQPLYVLKAEIKGKNGEYAYFALPFTPLGLNVFGKNIGALTGIDVNPDIKSKLKAIYDENMPYDNLEVILELCTQSGRVITTKESYTVNRAGTVSNKDLLLWPNFIAKNWNRYFLYSEMPHNTGTPFKATPIIGEIRNSDFRIIIDEDTEEKEPMLLAMDGNINRNERIERETGLKARLLVVSDNRVNGNGYKYEIYECNLPFKGVKLTYNDRDSGYLVIRYESAPKENVPRNLIGQENTRLHNATIGIDFGSTNTSVAYYVDGAERAEGIHFKNHRISLLQSGNRRGCQERDLFFFQSKEIEGNAIKSILTLHDANRMPLGDTAAEAREISGGMPCFDPSLLPVQAVNENSILLKCFAIGDVTLVHNMKWNEREKEINNKKAFLRSLMLHIYAQLYSQGCVPTRLKWSYPSAMPESLIRSYANIWRSLSENLSPVLKDDGNAPYSLQICRSDIGDIDYSDQNDIFGGNDASGWGSYVDEGQQGGWGDSADNGGWGASSNDGWGSSDSNDGWGAPAQEQNGWGKAQPADGWGAQSNGGRQQPVDDLEVDTNEVEFDFRDVDPEKCMTEACAVSNFMMSTGINATDESMSLIFDVGGSTTDISAIMTYQDHLTLIKQNSIRFAAQRVVQAAKHEPNLKSVLLEICNKYKLRIPGLNLGDDKFSDDTAAFYFEQVLDRLDPDQLHDMYHMISSRCHKLMAVNLYVTGLIVYYAGQITNKLVKVIRKSLSGENPMYTNFRPNINVLFAGKGSRIFEWFSTVEPMAAKQYFTQMFISGMGGKNEAQSLLWGPPEICLSQEVSLDVKYEVSKGLAVDSTKGIKVPKDSMESIEILGEDNFVIRKRSDGTEIPLTFENSVTPKMLSRIGGDFKQRTPQGRPFACNKFSDFALIFFKTASHFGLTLSQKDFMEGFRTMNINNYIMNLPEYRKAAESERKGTKFDFVAPIIILEGMKFYDNFLVKTLG